jgi:hypothetical protein
MIHSFKYDQPDIEVDFFRHIYIQVYIFVVYTTIEC